MSGIAALLLAAAAALQEPPTPRNGPEGGSREGPIFSLTGEGRVSIPVDGEVVPSRTTWFFFVPTTIKGTRYDDLFSNGTGVCLEATLTYEHPSRTSESLIWHTGGYLKVSYDAFEGSSHSDEIGNFIDTRSWEITTAIIGFRGGIRGTGGLFAEGRVGVGPVYYGAVKATFDLEGGPPASGELLAPTVGVASELGLKLGYRSEKMEIAFGMNLEIQGGPHRGDDVSTVVKPDAILFLSFTLGIGLRF